MYGLSTKKDVLQFLASQRTSHVMISVDLLFFLNALSDHMTNHSAAISQQKGSWKAPGAAASI